MQLSTLGGEADRMKSFRENNSKDKVKLTVQTLHGTINTTENNNAQPTSPNNIQLSELLNSKKPKINGPSICLTH